MTKEQLEESVRILKETVEFLEAHLAEVDKEQDGGVRQKSKILHTKQSIKNKAIFELTENARVVQEVLNPQH